MAAIDFPTATSNGQTFEADSGVIYTYVGTPPNGFWSGTFSTTGLNTLDGRYIAKNDENTLQTIQTQGLKFNSGSADTILLDGLNGKIGIGTTSPEDLLHIKSNNGAIRLENTVVSNNDSTIAYDNTNLAFHVDPNNVRGSSNITFSGDGSERMRIDSSGNVGVGTTSPDANLHIKGGYPTVHIERDSATNYSRLLLDNTANDGGAIDGIGDGVGGLRFATSDAGTITERLRIDSSGNVGIGTSSPSKLLEVSSAVTNGPVIRLNNGNTSVNSNDEYGRIEWYTNDASTGGTGISNYIAAHAENAGVLAALTFGVRDGSGVSEAMRIDNSGNVGIGTSSAGALLHASTGGTASTLNEIARIESTAGNSGPSFTFYGKQGSDASTKLSGLIGFTQTNNSDSDGRPAFVLHTGNNGSVSERLRVTHDGLVGIGTTSPVEKLDLANGVLRVVNTVVPTNENDGAAYFGKIMGGAELSHSAFIGLRTNGSERARIDSSGRLLVGTSTNTDNYLFQVDSDNGNVAQLTRYGADGATLVIGSSRGTQGAKTTLNNNDYGGLVAFKGYDGSNFQTLAWVGAQCDGQAPASGDSPGRLVFSTTADGASSPTERMRIRENGQVLINRTSSATGSILEVDASSNVAQFHHTGSGDTIGIYMRHGRGLSGFSGKMITFRRNDDTEVGSVVIGISSTAYNTSSDYRLKENIVAVADGIARLQQLKPSRFNFIDDPDRIVDGFIAHEVQTVVPEAITGEKDAVDDEGNPVYQGIDQSKLVPLLTAALQEAVAKIQSLEAADNNQFQNTSALLNQPLITFLNNTGGTAGEIIHSGVNSVTYATSSDYRLKENVTDLTAAIPRLKNLAPKRFNFIGADQVTVDGFLAHEAQTVVPEAVTGTYNEIDGDGNAIMQGIDQSKLVPLLTAALQEAIAKIETLETKVAALEAA